MSSMFAHDQTASDPVGADQYRITQVEQEVEGLSRALQTRDAIGQAKGILLSRFAMGPDEAFALLVRLSQNTNVKLADLAADLVTLVRERARPGPNSAAVPVVVDGLLARTAGPRPAQHIAPVPAHGDQHVPAR